MSVSSSFKPKRGLIAVATLAAALAVGSTLPAAATPSPASDAEVATHASTPQKTSGGHENAALSKGLNRLVKDDKFPAALAATSDRDGRIRNYAFGVADLKTGAKVPVDGQVRAGSNTKTFTSAVVLQLVGEGKVDLDAPIEKYLPKLVRGEGIDGRRITVRQLLNHTSGLPNYTEFMMEDLLKSRHTYYQPRALLDIALEHKAQFAPGTNWAYSNTNYILAGLLIEKVTGRPLDEQITRRVIEPAGLKKTYFPAVGEERIRGVHPKAYYSPKPGAPLEDVTELDPSWGWAAGQIVSTPSDLSRFFKALFDGTLLKPAQVTQLRTTVKVPDSWGAGTGARYGLGVTSVPLSCGGRMWGHGGDIPGHATRTGITDDGRPVAIAVTANQPPTEQGLEHAQALLDTAFCKK
ncbi:serine hydrolase domain-containing protein [Streptomyces sp. NPDC051561]|uniref:serine hydrolase domain-containing protein n=1 Tax=Streptomyces sp. NPDC051561 TaxID=3365658 RepID=UPI00378D337D